ALLLQTAVASRLLRYGGFAALLLVLPVVSLLSYSTLAVLPMLWLFRITKIAEDSTNYSLHNTAVQVLWLPTTREMKYQGKATVDTIFVRVGDGLAAVTAFAGIHLLAFSTSTFFAVNAVLAAGWVAIAAVVAREHGRWSRRRPAARETSARLG
ncbi:MAG: Npt1/Npt2 family nucleotide transporter, partial [Candidatus Binatia bacterium]